MLVWGPSSYGVFYLEQGTVTNKDVLVGLGRHARVLIVEDEPVSALILKRFFEQKGIRFDHAVNGEQAYELFRRNRYRLVVSDWRVPGVDGVELCRRCRSGKGQYVYFILCSSDSDSGDLKEAYEAGIDDFLLKPLDPESLFQRLQVARRILQIESSLHVQALEMESQSQALMAMNNSLVHASRRFEELFNGLPVACFTLDHTGLVYEWNRQSEKDFGIRTFEAFQHPVWDILGASSDGFWDRSLVDAIFRNDLLEDLDWSLRMPDGEERFFVCNVFGLRNPDGSLIGAISANLDITERKMAEQRIDEQMLTINRYARELQHKKAKLEKANRRLELLALTDGMTGLLNHRGFAEELSKAYDRHLRLKTPLSLVLMDVDHFKDFNDTFGHQGGDAVLQQLGDILLGTTRRHEPAARYGGEEFAVILEGANKDQAIAAAERFQAAIHKRAWQHRAVTASFGVTTLEDFNADTNELIRQADIALYASKHAGRDCVTHYSDALNELAA